MDVATTGHISQCLSSAMVLMLMCSISFTKKKKKNERLTRTGGAILPVRVQFVFHQALCVVLEIYLIFPKLQVRPAQHIHKLVLGIEKRSVHVANKLQLRPQTYHCNSGFFVKLMSVLSIHQINPPKSTRQYDVSSSG